MTTDRPKLYPGHQHRWTDHPTNPNLVRCTVCDFEAPRNVVEAFDTIHAEVAKLRAETAEDQVAHHPQCNSMCVGDMHMLLPDDPPEQETKPT